MSLFTILSASSLAFLCYYQLRAVRRPKVFGKKLTPDQISKNFPSLLKPYKPTPWCFNKHLQIAATLLKQKFEKPQKVDSKEQLFMPDGGLTSIEWLFYKRNPTQGLPIVVVLHSICGSSEDHVPMVQEIQKTFSCHLAFLNRRGHGNLKLTTPLFDPMGNAKDLRIQLETIRRRFPRSPIHGLGNSIGGCVLARYVKDNPTDPIITSAIFLSPGFETVTSLSRIHRLYATILTKKLQKYYLQKYKNQLMHLAHYHTHCKVKNITEFLNMTHRYYRLPTTDDYHEKVVNPKGMYDSNRKVYLLFICSEDDPICSVQNVFDHLTQVNACPNSLLILTKRGSHSSFLEGFSMKYWFLKPVIEFLQWIERDRVQG